MKFTNRDNRIENVSKNFYNYGSSEKYWKKKTKLVKWKKIPKDIIKKNFFFNDGKINIAYNCIKANIDKGLGNKIAIYLFLWRNNDLEVVTHGLGGLRPSG